jgi:hypothetical protein
MAILSARIARSRFKRLLTAQPITRRECRSGITARYSQPSRVQMQLMSPAHFWLGQSAVKSRSSRLGAMLNVWSVSVAALNFLVLSTTIPFSRSEEVQKTV